MGVDPSARTFQGENGRDDFRREQMADKVITLLTSGINISPMVIDGDWGTGKTEFCFKLIAKFKSTHPDHKLIYVDAFQADHADNPLVTILSAVISTMDDGTQKTNLIKRSLPVARMVLSTLTKAVVSHTLKQNADDISEEFSDAINDSAKTAIDNTIKVLIKDHEKAKDNIKALQNSLGDIAVSSPIVIFIDELDRCRPDFAVQMLETIKHTFDAENVFFVLVTNTSQLKAAIKHRYGSDVNAQRYLDKFIKFSFQLPTFVPSEGLSVSDNAYASSQYFGDLILQSPLLKDTILSHYNAPCSELARILIKRNHNSLREVELLVRNLEIYQALTNKIPQNSAGMGIAMLIIVAAYISCFHAQISHQIQDDKADFKTIFKVISGQDEIDKNTAPLDMNKPEQFGYLVARDCNKSVLDTLPLSDEWSHIRFGIFGTTARSPMIWIKNVLQSLRLAPHAK